MAAGEGIATNEIEGKLFTEGYHAIAGVDEAGRGALAGPVVAACVIPGDRLKIDGIRDSKELTPAKRAELCARILSDARGVGIGIVGAEDIDRMNILAATLEAMRLAFLDCKPSPDVIIVDGNRAFAAPVRVIPVVKGDRMSVTIAAASIVAKVTRDGIMDTLGRMYGGYGFERHKGYGTAEHLKAIYSRGPSEVHRMTFAPICEMEQGMLFDREENGFY
jgi:ribonuclease HII